MTNSFQTPSLPVVLLAAALAALTAGCGGQRRAAPVNAEQARQTLRSVLESWKGGQSTPGGQREARPPVVVQDMDWEQGCQLVDYQFVGDGRSRDANLHVRVDLVLRDKAGKERTKKAFYVVGTDPYLTVFRELPL
jgi:hypothetical protein